MKIILRIILVLVIIGIIASFTKPSDGDCKSAASTLVEQKLKKEVNSDYAIVNRLIEKASTNKVWVEDKIFYKEIKFTFKGNTRTIGYGYFGTVNVDVD